ncbi:hypothetical protein [Embleya scabrispora]|uniref:hypothetical protein n=1 Tax=Embleya scabrispora TaxID=159449 RepID=UPI0003749839|nr:hypothetical protein [Embleya scabrispora]MYS83924.1 hypothetical protein [Streptomyces sp. SID5474]
MRGWGSLRDYENLDEYGPDEDRNGLLTVDELARLDPPLEPVQAPRGVLVGPENTQGDLLFAIDDCAPTVFECADCGAITEEACVWRANRPQCRACRHLTLLLDAQREVRAGRRRSVEDVRRRLADDRLAVVAVRLVGSVPDSAHGRSVPPAAHLDVVDRDGRPLAKVCTRLVADVDARTPADALPAEQAAAVLRPALVGRRLVFWSILSLGEVQRAGERLRVDFGLDGGSGQGGPDGGVLAAEVSTWRGDVDPATYRPRMFDEPDDAGVLLDLMRRMAATPVPDADSGAYLSSRTRDGRRGVLIAVTGPPGAIRRVEAVLTATGMLADDGHSAADRPVRPAPHHPGFVTAHLPGLVFDDDHEPG